MSNLIFCQRRNPGVISLAEIENHTRYEGQTLTWARVFFDKYATAKSNGQLFLSAGLLADTIKDLYIIAVNDKEIETVLWHLLLGLLVTCLLLEVLGMGLSLYLSMQVYPCRTSDGVIEGPACRVAPSYGGTEGGDAAQSLDDLPECPKNMKLINDILTAVTFVLMTLHAVKSALEGAATQTKKDKTKS